MSIHIAHYQTVIGSFVYSQPMTNGDLVTMRTILAREPIAPCMLR